MTVATETPCVLMIVGMTIEYVESFRGDPDAAESIISKALPARAEMRRERNKHWGARTEPDGASLYTWTIYRDGRVADGALIRHIATRLAAEA